MITLAIDTSGQVCAAALHDDSRDAILAETSEDIGRGHAERLMDVVALTLQRAGLGYAGLGRVAACAGPGSFTGVRVGLATARGIALGLGIAAVGVSALEALRLEALAASGGALAGTLLVAIEAGRGQAYGEMFGRDGIGRGAFHASLEELASFADGADALCGSAAPGLAASARLPVIHALAVAPIARFARLGAAAPPGARPEPIYLRQPDARPQAGFAVSRA